MEIRNKFAVKEIPEVGIDLIVQELKERVMDDEVEEDEERMSDGCLVVQLKWEAELYKVIVGHTRNWLVLSVEASLQVLFGE